MSIDDDGLYEVGNTAYLVCWCQDGLHRPGYRSSARVPGKPEVPHLIGIRSFEMAWRVG